MTFTDRAGRHRWRLGFDDVAVAEASRHGLGVAAGPGRLTMRAPDGKPANLPVGRDRGRVGVATDFGSARVPVRAVAGGRPEW